ncbi:MAG: hypothetical protein ACPL1A_05695 [Candidatus Kapaibacteriota bacterium]
MREIIIIIIIFFEANFDISAKIWNVGQSREYKYCNEISNLVSDGDTIYIDSEVYLNVPQVTWTKNNLYISGINGVPVLTAGALIENDFSNGKGIFVVKGNNTKIEKLQFENTKVPDRNGAGIRQEGSNLYVSHCTFKNNEMGLLQGGTIPNCTIKIEYCKFYSNGSSDNPGYQHNIYINHIDSLIFQFNYTYDAVAQGHELKSRADNNFILYNKIANYTSEDSRNIDLPNGGTAIIMGNIIIQGTNSVNTNIIGYGLEGSINKPPHNLWICNNTIINNKNKGSFVNVKDTDTLFMYNNICAGPKTGGFIIGNYANLDTNFNLINDDIKAFDFVSTESYDYHLTNASMAINSGNAINKIIKGYLLTPTYEYVEETSKKIRKRDNNIDIGAYEYEATGITNDKVKEKCYVSPNFVYEKLYLNNLSAYNQNFEIYNYLGIRVLFGIIDNEIDVSTLSTGIYYLIIENEQTLKFVKV